ncbi:HlyD family secretion protein [Methylocystis iwaonis]|uniref:HlyD family secretion protein n=1 Tax=Methylocystis iwaonis TaxID=2885079 RepID=UPI002E7C075A|nr:HlyD family efflux transporter periplasmic adaptor subunit [Methylocystis iwaonis]
MSRRTTLIVVAAVVGIGGYFGYQYWLSRQNALPAGIASGNGRVEAKLVDISPKESLRVKEIRFQEGDLVRPGDICVLMDTNTIEAQLEEAKLNVVATQEKEAVEKATIERIKAQIELAKVEVVRSKNLVAQRAGSQRELDVRNTQLKTTTASLQEEEAKLRTILQEVAVAQAKVATIQTRIDDATLRSPVLGRVLYKLAEVGEVLAAGGKAMTLVNLQDVYMEIYLPAADAARVRLGAQARIVPDHVEGRTVAGYVSFVSPEAQFTPKQVETRSEREKLMFRVKIKVPEKTVSAFIEYLKTGVRGVGYVKLDDSVEWPSWLQKTLEPPETNGKAAAAKENGQ